MVIRPLFRPERWANIPNAAFSVPGVWANLLTFIGGPRACIGFRFSLVGESYLFYGYIHQHCDLIFFLNPFCLCIRTKALIFTLIRAFEIDLAVSPKDLGSRPTNIRRPILLTDPNNSNQMPLLVRPVSSNF